MICFAAITPHPPIIIPGIGSGKDLLQVENTVRAMESLADAFVAAQPETIVLISPHAKTQLYSFGINVATRLKGNLRQFGHRGEFDLENDTALAAAIRDGADTAGVTTHRYESSLDHGALVPLHFLTQILKPRLTHLSFCWLDFSEHFQYGAVIADVLASRGERIAIIASGDLSHRLIPGAPAGYSKRGREFDERLIELLQSDGVEELLRLDADFVDDAGECGFRSILMLLGMLKGSEYQFSKLCYEGPFGVGYLVARLV